MPPGEDYKQNISCILWLAVAIKHNMKHNEHEMCRECDLCDSGQFSHLVTLGLTSYLENLQDLRSWTIDI